MQTSIILGLLGDAFTFAGGAILAWDAVTGTTRHKREKTIRVALDSPLLKGRAIEIDRNIVNSANAAEDVFIHFATKKAKIGFGVLALGFLLLLAHRIMELCI